MIPKRIKVAGFLSYKDEQEIAFHGSPLWMLSGLNGTGKSSIFDAVTYALFGMHRGGKLNQSELINKGANGFSVEFDFQLEGCLYQIQRTYKKRGSTNQSSQQVLQWHSDPPDGAGRWTPIAGTHRVAEFDAWVRVNVGLSFETFTSSILLLQGKAEKLLDSTPKGRAEVLASIVDLARYQKLHEKADGERKELRGQVEELQNQLNATPEVAERELAEARERIQEAERRAETSRQDVERLQQLEFSARQWAEIQRKLQAAQFRRASAAKLIQEAAAIEKDLNRLKELRSALPHVDAVFQRRNDLRDSEERTKAHADELRDLVARQAEIENRLEQIKERRAQLQNRIGADEQRHRDLQKRLPDFGVQLERIRQVEQRREELTKLEVELKKLPEDAPRQLEGVQARVAELTNLHRSLSPLLRLAESRGELRKSTEQLAKLAEMEKQVQERGEELRSGVNKLKEQFGTAQESVRAANAKLGSKHALLKQASDLRDELDKMEGAKNCRACGQPLTPAHLESERVRRDQDKVDAAMHFKQAEKALTAAETNEKAIKEQLAASEHTLQSARDEYREVHQQVHQARQAIARATNDCQRAYNELAGPVRSRVSEREPADWTKTEYPTSAELERMRGETAELPAAERSLENLRTACEKFKHLSALAATAHANISALAAAVPGDHAEIRRQAARTEADAKALAGQIQAARDEVQSAQSEIDGLSEQLAKARESVSDRKGRLQAEEKARDFCKQAIASARKSLSPEWQGIADRSALADLNRLRGDLAALEANGAEMRAGDLQKARIEIESLKQTLAELERERDQVPDDARREPDEVQKELVGQRSVHAARMDDFNIARNKLTNLENRAQQRQELRSRLSGVETNLKRCKILAELLGRDRLQRHLVRQAERQIVEYANGVLDRLSEGTMMLRLVGSDDGANTDHALELEAYNRVTGQSPINVAFLSGSQRFRVAVSLALGIGQYASRLHRPIESVIIDEGFGCLDRQGRQVMIQEMHNLRGHLHCIMLVSHQEEFAEAFSDGYRFELQNGTTKISRIQR